MVLRLLLCCGRPEAVAVDKGAAGAAAVVEVVEGEGSELGGVDGVQDRCGVVVLHHALEADVGGVGEEGARALAGEVGEQMVGEVGQVEGFDVAQGAQDGPDLLHGFLDGFFELQGGRDVGAPAQEGPAESPDVRGILGMGEQGPEEGRLLGVRAVDFFETVVELKGDAHGPGGWVGHGNLVGLAELVVKLGAVAVGEIDGAAVVEAEVDGAVEEREAVRV